MKVNWRVFAAQRMDEAKAERTRSAQLQTENERLHAAYKACELGHKAAMRYIDELLAENDQLKQALAKRQEPEAQREQQVAQWLMDRGWTVTNSYEKSAKV